MIWRIFYWLFVVFQFLPLLGALISGFSGGGMSLFIGLLFGLMGYAGIRIWNKMRQFQPVQTVEVLDASLEPEVESPSDRMLAAMNLFQFGIVIEGIFLFVAVGVAWSRYARFEAYLNGLEGPMDTAVKASMEGPSLLGLLQVIVLACLLVFAAGAMVHCIRERRRIKRITLMANSSEDV